MREIVTILGELIKFKTTVGNRAELDRCTAFIEEYLGELGFEYTRMDENGVPSILVTPEEGHAPVLLMSHMDVVDGDDSLFIPVEKDGKLHGRGSVDDKYAVALSLYLLKKWINIVKKEGGGQKDLPFGVLITGDEEVGGDNGARIALEKVKADFCIALDGGNLEKIVLREKGVLNLKLVARGKAAHGARTWLGQNAVDILVDDLVKVRAFFSDPASLNDEDARWQRTLNTGIVAGGRTINQVPDYAEARLDIRYTEKDDVDALIEDIRGAVKSEVIVTAKEPVFDSGKSPYLDLLTDVAQSAETGNEHGASDARFLAAHGIPGVVWGANGDMTHHTENERLNIDSLYELCELLNEFLTRSIKITG